MLRQRPGPETGAKPEQERQRRQNRMRRPMLASQVLEVPLYRLQETMLAAAEQFPSLQEELEDWEPRDEQMEAEVGDEEEEEMYDEVAEYGLVEDEDWDDGEDDFFSVFDAAPIEDEDPEGERPVPGLLFHRVQGEIQVEVPYMLFLGRWNLVDVGDRSMNNMGREVLKALRERLENLQAMGQVLVELQQEFLELLQSEASYLRLKAITDEEMGRRIGVHKSTVGRIRTGVHAGLPDGSVVPLSIFFGDPRKFPAPRWCLAREIRRIICEEEEEKDVFPPLSSEEIATRLAGRLREATNMGVAVSDTNIRQIMQAFEIPSAPERRRAAEAEGRRS